MRLPHNLQQSPWFLFSEAHEVVAALGNSITPFEKKEIRRISKRELPPITSAHALSVMIGINPGMVWSFLNRTRKHYRIFEIPKGKGKRSIAAPRVGLKTVQTWISYHIAKAQAPLPHVYGFVPGRSHIDAAFQHRNAEWAFSVDITDFFPSTPATYVADAFRKLGYMENSAHILTTLTCLNGFLAQGAPTSPSLSNLCFRTVDNKLMKIASKYNCELTRYADDITLSGRGEFPQKLRSDLRRLFSMGPWRLADEKEKIQPIKGRIKVHGLLISDGSIKLTKGYRNKLRAYNHIIATRGVKASNLSNLKGHASYSSHVDQRARVLQASAKLNRKDDQL